ncbi:MAG: hypothetical protein NWE89_15935 [Candidatus Bathyarchaeota archaeon]|nr:hypothetical protein [Candidatus Bathyarchaeota archaeon]
MTAEDKNKVLQVIKKDAVLEKYFFQQVANSSDLSDWFKLLHINGYFDPSNNPPPQLVEGDGTFYTIPKWNVLDYLNNMSIYLNNNPDDKALDLLIHIIDDLMWYSKPDGDRIDNFRTDVYILKILFNLPIDKITEKHISFIRIALNTRWNSTLIVSEVLKSILPKLVEYKCKSLLICLLEIILSYNKKDHVFTVYESIIGDYWFGELVTKFKYDLYEICEKDLLNIIKHMIRKISDDKKSEFEYGSIVTIENSDQNISTKYSYLMIILMRDFLICYEDDDLSDVLSELLYDELNIFKRMAIYIISCKYEKSSDLLWDVNYNPLDIVSLKREMFEFIVKNNIYFECEKVDKILYWMDAVSLQFPENMTEEQQMKIRACHDKEWLLAFSKTNDKRVSDRFEAVSILCPEKIPHPGYSVWTSRVSISVPESKPLENELLEMTNEDLSTYLSNIPEKSVGTRWDETILGGLKRSIQDNPLRFSQNLSYFLSNTKETQYVILSGLYESWKQENDFDWADLFQFIIKILDTVLPVRPSYKDHSYDDLIIRKICELIDVGTKDDSHVFNADYLPFAETILVKIYRNYESQLEIRNEVFMDVINSTKGILITSMINLSLRYARVNKKQIWLTSIQTCFDETLDLENIPIEFSVMVGAYLKNLMYLNEVWVSKNIDRIFPEDEENWKNAFIGYLWGINRLPENIFEMINSKGHYQRAIEQDFENNDVNSRLAQHIITSYLYGYISENSENNLINRLILSYKPQIISHIILFVYRVRDDLSPEHLEKILFLWKTIVDEYSDKLERNEVKTIFSKLTYWISLLNQIDERNYYLLTFTAKCVHVDFNIISFIDELNRLVITHPSKVGQLFYIMLESSGVPIVSEEKIKSLVNVLFENEEYEILTKICRKYMAEGVFYLRDFCNKIESS